MLHRGTPSVLTRIALVVALLVAAVAWTVPAVAVDGSTGAAPSARVEAPRPEGHGPPGDAPHFPSRNVEKPPTPAGYNTFRAHDWIRFSYPPEIRQQVEPLAEAAARVRAELGAFLGQSVLRDVDVRIARTPGEMAELAPQGRPFPKYASGVAYSQVGLVLLTIQPIHPNADHDLLEVFKHELAHVALHDAVGGAPVPRWFNEGFAVFASGEGSIKRLRTLWTATLADEFQSLRDLERTFPSNATDASVAYAQAADIVRFLLRQQDRERFKSLVTRMRAEPGTAVGQPFETALRDAYGTDLANLEYEWRENVAKRYTFWPVLFSGTVVWSGMIGLFVFAWRRKRRRNKETLERWAEEEAREDARRARERTTGPRVHIVLARDEPISPEVMRPSRPDGDVPKVEHDGRWHTLH